MIPHKGENVPNGILNIFCHIGRTFWNLANYSENDIQSGSTKVEIEGSGWGCVVFLCLHNWYWLLCEMEWWHTEPGVNMGCVQQYYGELIELYRVEHDRLSR